MAKKKTKAATTTQDTRMTFGEILERHISRRALMQKSALAVSAMAVVPTLVACDPPGAPAVPLGFTPVTASNADELTVPEGYEAKVLIRWGDPLFDNVPEFDLNNQTAAKQAGQLGYNVDYLGYFPLPAYAAANPSRALLSINLEWDWEQMMHPGYTGRAAMTREQFDISLEATGVAVIEVKRDRAGEWSYLVGSKFNRRISLNTPIQITGPAAGDAWMKTNADPTGRLVIGTMENCAGGVTPWGTLLSCEESINNHFGNASSIASTDPRRAVHTRYGIPSAASPRLWENHYPRFNVATEPNEPFRFGWVVEVDPYEPTSTPKKRTALGRLKHEGAETIVAPNGRLAVYMGEDEAFQCIYKYVSNAAVSNTKAENATLLDQGVLHVAKFNEDGTGVWVPLIAGEGALASWTQAQVCIDTRGAAAAVGGTPMDKPEDVQANPRTGKIYCALTNNTARGAAGRPGVDAANPRANNANGHIIEITEDGDDNSGRTFTWSIFIKCGDPAVAAHDTYFGGFDQTQVSPIACPDNLTFDTSGNLWIGTDGVLKSPLTTNDGLFAVPLSGPDRGHLRQFMHAPYDSEITGPVFNSDSTALFVSIQHPGRIGTLANLVSHWPDGDFGRPAVVVVTKTSPGPKVIGS